VGVRHDGNPETGSGQIFFTPKYALPKGSGSDSPILGARPSEGLFSFFKRYRADPSYSHSTTDFLSRLIGLDKPRGESSIGQQPV